ncbi:MAG: type VI-B CRISPR-associated RNA-guided ribonuclease Cas13b [Planctomycetaceae bacterium]|jgi:hypothetical protein|nr:type VI-B CRISPR-associated RNA-guided ribonuclease Cas13b [Planctomycetaceae bacterium]
MTDKIMDDFTKHLPFLKEIRTYRTAAHKNEKEQSNVAGSQISPAEFAKLLENYAVVLFEYRNFFTHVEHEPARIHSDQRKDITLLDTLLDINSRTVKERFGYKEPPVSREDEMRPLRRYKGMKNVQENGKDSKLPKENPQFACQFFILDENNDKIGFTPVGLAFFAAQFLETKYISQMLQVVNNALTPKTQEMLLRAYCINSIHLPRTRLTTDEELTPQTLGMDIVAELHKCPGELFDMLSPDDQNAFRYTDEEEQKENLLKRFKKGRFTYLALNYLDLQEKLPTLRFHIDKGNFFYASYEKGLMDGSQINRRLSKRVYCFKRIQDAQLEYKQDRDNVDRLYWKPKLEEAPTGEFRVDMLPQYKIEKEQIGIVFGDVNEPKLAKALRTGKRFLSRKPTAWLPLAELPFLVFLATQNRGEAVEKVIRDFLENWKKLRQALVAGLKVTENDVAETYHLNFTDLPDDVRTFIKTGQMKTPQKDILKNLLQELINQTQRKLDNFKKEMDIVYKQGGFKQGKRKKQPRFKTGSMALFLARDVVRLQKPLTQDDTHCGKITSANFAVLQSSLALFDHRKDQLKEIFNKAGLTRNPEFVENLLRSDMSSLEHFFEQYLKKKLKWLKDFQSQPEDCYILRKAVKRLKPKNVAEWLEKLKDEAVNLPRGLFAELILETIKDKFPKEFAELQKNTSRYNSTFLIQKFLEWEKNGNENTDKPQWFYELQKDANSPILSRLTKFLVPKKQSKVNPIEIPVDKQKELYDLWLKAPNLTALYKIAKEYNKLAIDSEPDYRAKLQVDYNKAEQRFNDAVERYENAPKEDRYLKRKTDEAHDAMIEAEALLEKPLPNKERFNRIVSSFDKIEKNIRRSKMQDIVLFYAAKELLQLDRLEGGVRLSDIKRDKFMLNEIQLLGWKFNIASDSRLNVTDLELKLTGTMKVKNFGNFRRIINDVRTPSFLRLYHQVTGKTEVDYEYLVKQFDEYDNGRKEVFEAIHELEKKVIKERGLKRTGEIKLIDFSHILNEMSIPKANKYLLFVYRNAFSHQRYPEFAFNDPDITDEKELVEYEKCFAKEQAKMVKPPKEMSLTKWILKCTVDTFSKYK